MCGFALLLSVDQQPSPQLVRDMATRIAHRGPDDYGEFSENLFAVAFRRLAIFDLADSGHQPMVSADERHVIVFNGAVYNFVELRSELAALGHVFRSTGDTEVLLEAYKEWGADCLPRLNGMFAFVVYDRRAGRIFAARDRFGIKPLFWHHDARGLAMASEIKALRTGGFAGQKPNWPVIADFLLEQHLNTTPETFFEGIHSVPPGTWFETDARSAPTFHRYWNLEGVVATGGEGSDPVEEFRSLFDDSVRLRMRSDVPVGVLLSGGLDSTSIITSMADQLKASASGSSRLDALCYVDAGFDETPFINATIQRTGATLVRLVPDEDHLWELLETNIWHQDEPVHSFTSVVTYQLMQMARERGLKVLLNGQGADEVLAGYSPFFMDYWSGLVRTGQLLRARREIEAFAAGHQYSSRALYRSVAERVIKQLQRLVPGHSLAAAYRRKRRIAANPWVSADIKRLWVPRVEHHPLTLSDSLRDAVERSPLPLYLRLEDRNSMAHSVEVRLPFLDYRLVSLAFRLNNNWKLRGAYTKVVLRDAMKGRIAENVRQRATKFGFPTSVNAWFRGRLYERCRDVLASRAVRESGVWNVAELDRALTRHKNGEETLGNQLFDVVQFTSWFSQSGFGTAPAERFPEKPATEHDMNRNRGLTPVSVSQA